MAVRIGGRLSSAPEVILERLAGAATALFAALTAPGSFTLFVGLCGQTPGKALLGQKIIRTTGDAVGYAGALLRWIGQVVGLSLFGLGVLRIAF